MPEWIECELSQILLMTDNIASPQVIVLKEKRGERSFPVHIGLFEALAINRQIHGEQTPRPMTHDLLWTVIKSLESHVAKVVVSDLAEDGEGNGMFYGLLALDRNGDELNIDCRPSDAIALAVRAGCPIYVSGDVLDRVTGS